VLNQVIRAAAEGQSIRAPDAHEQKSIREAVTQERIAAQELLTKRLAEVVRGDHVAARARLTFGEVCARYLASKVNIRDSTMRSYAGLIACYLRPYFGSWKIHTISASDIERYRADLARGLPPAIADALKERRSAAKPKWSQARVKQSLARRNGPHLVFGMVDDKVRVITKKCAKRICGWHSQVELPGSGQGISRSNRGRKAKTAEGERGVTRPDLFA
jgi:hypothetical protein